MWGFLSVKNDETELFYKGRELALTPLTNSKQFKHRM
jgi:hypothetical protein